MDPRIAKVIRTIDTVINCGDDEARAALSVQRLAEDLGMTRFHLQRLFKRDTGITISHYLQDALLSNAAVRVRFSRESLLSIALTQGFGSQQAFTRAFTRRWGVPPGELRRRAADAPEVPGGYPPPLSGAAIPVRIVRSAARTLWARRYLGPYPRVPQHWQDFRDRLRLAGLPSGGPFFGVIHDDPQFTPPERIRYACAVEAPPGGQELPPDWQLVELPASRFAVFSIHCAYLEGLARLRPRVHDWLAQSGESFGGAAGFEYYLALPAGSPDQAQYMELHCSLAG